MDTQAIQTAAHALLRGQLEDRQPWELGAVAQWIADAISQRSVEITKEKIRAACAALNAHRHYDPTRLLAQTWIELNGFDVTLQRQWAQGLINLSALDAAQALLQDGLARLQACTASALAAKELPEYRGLLARIEKQRFANNGDLDALVAATDAYLSAYRTLSPPSHWHGINAAALLTRQTREGLSVRDVGITAEQIAKDIHTRLVKTWQTDTSDRWMAVSLSEAALALGRFDEAELWLYRFLHHPQTRPFDIDSYDRQLREIWQANAVGPGPEGPSRLARIIAQHVMRSQSRLAISPSTLSAIKQELANDPVGLEKNFSGERNFSLDSLRNMIAACDFIGCVSNRLGQRLGTGFLLCAGELSPSDIWNSTPVFVTNAHVISKEMSNAIAPDDALISFEAEAAAKGAPTFYSVAEVLYTSLPAALGARMPDQDHLDVTIVRLQGVDDPAKGLTLAKNLPLIDRKSRAYVVGHPLGSGLQISLHDSQLLDIDDERRLIHYRTPTDPGSSGSPVFNGAWKVIALHHGGSAQTPRLHGEGHYEANEGITLEAIRRKLPS